MAERKNGVLYVSATQKQKSNVAYFGITVSKKSARKLQEFSGIYQSNGRMETQLKAMIHGISLADDSESLTVYTDSKFFENFNNGTVDTWEMTDWSKPNGTPIENADLWQELNNLVQSRNIVFTKPKKKDMEQVIKLMNAEKEKSEVFMNLNLGSLNEKYALETGASELKQEEADEIVVEIKREGEAELNQDETDNLVSKTKPPATKEKKARSKTKKGTKVVEEVVRAEEPTPVVQKTKVTDKRIENSGLSIDLDEKTLAECDSFFEELGLDTQTAVKLFLKQSLRSKAIPFELKLN